MLFLVQGCKYSWNSRIGSTTVRPEDNAVPYIPRFTFPWTTGGRYTNRLGQSRAVNMSQAKQQQQSDRACSKDLAQRGGSAAASLLTTSLDVRFPDNRPSGRTPPPARKEESVSFCSRQCRDDANRMRQQRVCLRVGEESVSTEPHPSMLAWICPSRVDSVTLTDGCRNLRQLLRWPPVLFDSGR
ncbi:hypothetical protein ISCGN_014842 [Ixodes scapularis]